MNLTYFKFLFVTTFKKRPVWITCALILLTCSIFIILIPALTRMNTLQLWANTTMMICESFLGMTIALFSSVLGIHIFQDGQTDGTELIVVAKPIKRQKIILTKFFIFGTYCLIVNILTLILTSFTIFLPATELKFYWGLIVSMFIGNSVAFLFFGALTIILTVKMAKTGVIVINILVSLVLIIYQILSLLVFKIPARSLIDHGVVTPTYMLISRKDDGSYDETRVVKFGLTDANPVLSEDKKFKLSYEYSTWTDTENYWKDTILRGNPTILLNFTDIAGQLAMSYISVGIDSFSNRQDFRNFVISRYYNYQLASPASPEIKESAIKNKKTLNWIYTGRKNIESYSGKITYQQPWSFGFAGISPLSGNRLKGFGDLIPVGVYAPAGKLITSINVYLEKDEFNMYKDAFQAMYDVIFDWNNGVDEPSLTLKYKIDNLGYDQYPTAWASNNYNLNTYYNRIWVALNGSKEQVTHAFGEDSKIYNIRFNTGFNFNIHNIADLNERFIQFKYYAYLQALKEQQKVFNAKPTEEKELIAYNKALNNLQVEGGVYDYLKIKNIPDTFFIEKDPDNPETILHWSYAEDNTIDPDMNLLVGTYNQLKNDITDEDEKAEKLPKSKLAIYNKTASIYNNCCANKENYLFNSLSKPSRSAEQTGSMYTISDTWYSYWDTTDLFQLVPKGQNMQYFFYDVKQRTPFWIYPVIWSTISMIVMAAASHKYRRYDFK